MKLAWVSVSEARPTFPVLATYTLEIVAMVLVWSYLLTHPREAVPAEADAVIVIGFAQMTGFLILLYFYFRPRRSYIRGLRTLLYGGTTIMILPAIIGAQQDTLNLTLSLDNLLVAVTVIMLCSSMVLVFCRVCAGDVPDGDTDVRVGTAAGRTTSTVSVQDRRIIAAHEAGHALMYAAWSPFPTKLQVIVKSQADNSGSLGYVRCEEPQPRLMDKNRDEWEMLLALAGMAGERHYTGTVSSGAVDDGKRWLSHAVPWLICHLKTGIYFPDPATFLELESNQRHLTTLKASQNSLLEAFFDLNHEVHTRLTEALLTGKPFGAGDMHSYLMDVQLPEGFPRMVSSSGS